MDKNLESEKSDKKLSGIVDDNNVVENNLETSEKENVTADHLEEVDADESPVEKVEVKVETPLEERTIEFEEQVFHESADHDDADESSDDDGTDLSDKESGSNKFETEGLTKDEIIGRLKDLVVKGEVPNRQETDALKQAFYTLRRAEVDAEREQFEKESEDFEDFTPSVDPSEDVLKVYLNTIKERRAKKIEEENKVKEQNYRAKLDIIEEIKKLIDSTDDFNKLYKDFKDLQNKWNEIKLVPQARARELWTEYQIQSEKFYDLVKINNELRDYDFKKNLELKTEICEAAEKLLDGVDPVSAFHQLQNFHHQWREIGPVAREQREELWTRFKEVSTTINKNYQAHFESLKSQEEENLNEKTAIINELKEIDYSKVNSYKEWNRKTKEVLALQAKWRTIGFVPRKVNAKIFEEFRGLCDVFFENKSQFFKGQREEMEANLVKKQALVDRALELKDSQDWKKTADILIQLQKDWKKVGPVPRKNSDVIWREFVGACDHFFNERKKYFSSQKNEEVDNLKAKKEIVEKIKELDKSLNASELLEQLHVLQDEWHKIGFVPYRDKDKAYQQFYAAVDAHYERLKIDKDERRFEEFKSSVEDKMSSKGNPEKELSRERTQLVYQYNKLKSDLQTYENNMSFLSVSSKGKENPLLKDVMKKVESLKSEMELIEKKVETLDANLKELD